MNPDKRESARESASAKCEGELKRDLPGAGARMLYAALLVVPVV